MKKYCNTFLLYRDTPSQGHDTLLGHGQGLCEILSRSDKGVRSGPETMLTDCWTDRQGDSYIPPKLCLRGYNKNFYGPQTKIRVGWVTLLASLNNLQLEWGYPNGTKYPPRQPIPNRAILPNRAHVYRRTDRQTDRVIPVYPP